MREMVNCERGLAASRQKIYVGIHPHKDVASIPKTKNSDIVRLGFNNVDDGIPVMVTNNSKVNAIRRYAYKHDLDGFFGAETNINWKKMPDEGQLSELFCSEHAIQTVSSFNRFENWGRRQQGGTFNLVFCQLASKVQDVGSDDLSRWSWMLFQGHAGHKMRIIMAYQPVVQKATMIGLVYQQHQHHYIAESFLPSINPIEKFRTDLVTQLRQWRSFHECLILFINANENTVDGPLNSALSAPGLLMRKGVYSLHPSLPHTPSFQ
jgi:hypothetical protein